MGKIIVKGAVHVVVDAIKKAHIGLGILKKITSQHSGLFGVILREHNLKLDGLA